MDVQWELDVLQCTQGGMIYKLNGHTMGKGCSPMHSKKHDIFTV